MTITNDQIGNEPLLACSAELLSTEMDCALATVRIFIFTEKAERLRKEEAMRTPLPHLLGYLADGRYLTVEELDRIQDHIRERKNRLLASKGLPPEPSHGTPY